MTAGEENHNEAFGMDVSIDYLRECSHYKVEEIVMMGYSYFMDRLAFFSSKAEARKQRQEYENKKAKQLGK